MKKSTPGRRIDLRFLFQCFRKVTCGQSLRRPIPSPPPLAFASPSIAMDRRLPLKKKRYLRLAALGFLIWPVRGDVFSVPSIHQDVVFVNGTNITSIDNGMPSMTYDDG